MKLTAQKQITVRFSEVDSMKVVWHGSYVTYFEDAREEFGKQFGLAYQGYIDEGYYAPIVDLQVHYKYPLRYNECAVIEITYQPTESAKIVFDYEIKSLGGKTVYCTGKSVQVFMTLDYQLVWQNPDFYENWKKKWQQL